MGPWILAMLLGCDDPQSEMKQTEDSAVPADDPLPPDDSHKRSPEWAIYIFMNGDNDLSLMFYDLNELEEVGSSDNVHVVVQADRSEGYWAGAGLDGHQAVLHHQRRQHQPGQS